MPGETPTEGEHPSFGGLFRGAARIGAFVAPLGLQWERLAPYLRTFPVELDRYLELSYDPATNSMGLMTRGDGREYAFRLARFMEEHGIGQERLKRFLVRSRFLEHTNLFFKMEFGEQGPTELSYYFRRRPGLEVARAWLADTGVSDQDMAPLEAVASVLEKRTVHFLAASERLDGSHAHKIYFSQPAETDSWERVRAAANGMGVGERTWDVLEDQRDHLDGHTLFVSLGWQDGQVQPGCKVDVHGVPGRVLDTWTARAGLRSEARDRAKLLVDLHQRGEADYVGLSLGTDDRPPAVKVYCYRSALRDGQADR